MANAQGDAPVIADAMQIESIYIAPFMAVPMLIILVIGMYMYTGRRRRRNRRAQRIMKSFGFGKDGE